MSELLLTPITIDKLATDILDFISLVSTDRERCKRYILSVLEVAHKIGAIDAKRNLIEQSNKEG